VSHVTLNAMQAVLLQRVNHYRTMTGVAPVSADERLQRAAQSHASYLNSTGQAGHFEAQPADPYFTGRTPFQRIDATGYNYAVAGEVVGSVSTADPATALDELIAAIYHRFIILSGDFSHAGLGVASRRVQGSDVTDVTVDFGSLAERPAQPPSALTLYPVADQQGVPLDFDPTHESPNPMPGRPLVGYPISIQVDAHYTLGVRSFTLHAVIGGKRGPALPARLLTHGADLETPAYGAALVPLSPLSPSTTYEAAFSGSAAGAAISRSWRFTAAAQVVPRLRFASSTVRPGGTQRVTLTGLDLEKGDYYVCHGPPQLVTSLTFEGEATFVLTTSRDCAPGRSCEVIVATSYLSSCAVPFAKGSFTIGP
jgi:Cysteine-rich secretory protein family